MHDRSGRRIANQRFVGVHRRLNLVYDRRIAAHGESAKSRRLNYFLTAE
jgi:hypothetical protein